jgi:hypothetical protein
MIPGVGVADVDYGQVGSREVTFSSTIPPNYANVCCTSCVFVYEVPSLNIEFQWSQPLGNDEWTL